MTTPERHSTDMTPKTSLAYSKTAWKRLGNGLKKPAKQSKLFCETR